MEKTFHMRVKERVKITVRCKRGEIIYICCFVKDIFSPIANQPLNSVKTIYPHLVNSDLADSNYSDMDLPIDILNRS